MSKEWKMFDTNSKPLLEVTWKEIPCLENIWRTNRHTRSADVMVLWVGINITLTKIVSNLEDDRSFLIKFIEMEFHGHLGIGSCLRDP